MQILYLWTVHSLSFFSFLSWCTDIKQDQFYERTLHSVYVVCIPEADYKDFYWNWPACVLAHKSCAFCGVISCVEIFMHGLRSCRWEKHLLWTKGRRCRGEGLRNDLTSFKKVQRETRALFQRSDLPLHAHTHACNARHCPHKNPALTFRIPQCAEVFVLDTNGSRLLDPLTWHCCAPNLCNRLEGWMKQLGIE